jgi:signal transduction histidine kinase
MAVEGGWGFSSVATVPPTPRQRRQAFAIVAVLGLAFAATIPFGRIQLAQVDSFVPTVEGIIVVTDLLTAVLLFSQYPAGRSRAVLVLASGFLFCAFVVGLHALSFPGAFAPAGVIGGGPQSTPWLYTFWRVGFAAAIFGYAMTKDPKGLARDAPGAGPAFAIGWSIAVVLALVLVVAAVVTLGEKHLPALIADPPRFSPLSPYVSGVTLTLTAVALVLLAVRRRSLLGLWLMVVTCAFVAELVVNTFVITSRFCVGFYAGRAFSLITSVLVLALLVAEIARLYARLARANVALERERANRLMNIEAATSAIVHEIRQPLTAIALNAGAARMLLDADPPAPARLLRAVNALVDDTERAREILGAVRDLFGKAAGPGERIDMNELALDALRSLQAELDEHGVLVAPELTADLPPVHGSRGQLREVVVNLVRNAIEAMQANTERVRRLRVATQRRDRDTIEVLVADSGPGIDPGQLDKIFDAFVTTKAHGMGLGLAICRTIVDRHGGELTASSDADGAKFRLILPIALAAGPD